MTVTDPLTTLARLQRAEAEAGRLRAGLEEVVRYCEQFLLERYSSDYRLHHLHEIAVETLESEA